VISSSIKEQARQLGFDLCGISPVDDFPELAYLRDWIDLGYAGEMAWMARTAEKRADVRNVVPGARSVVMTATLYNTDRPYSQELPADVARIMHAKWSLGLAGGIVIANPIPEQFELHRERIERAIEQAVQDARTQGIAGKAVTPFLLARVNESTGGDSLEANVALVRNNATVAAKIAAAYATLS